MKTKIKGIVVAGFFAVILITSTLTLAFTNSQPNPLEKSTVTGTPADNYSDVERPRYCGTQDAKSNQYVTEYKIPTECTQPLAITVDPQGQVWFAQTNTGKMTRFDPQSKEFTEYENPAWPQMGRSMMWGIDYAYDGNIWYTDDANDSIWKFSTIEKKYEQIEFPSKDESLPQQLMVRANQVIVNDFYGGKISFLDTAGEQKIYKSIPSPLPGSFVSGFDVDSGGNVWYTNWMLRQGGALVKLDYARFSETLETANNSTLEYIDVYTLPPNLGTPVGLTVDESDNVWIADTTSSSFFKFEPTTQTFTKYVTPNPRQDVYGNATGVIKTPVTGPYWTQLVGGKLIFNEQLGNAIAVFDIKNEHLVEYSIPSQNSNWTDCGQLSNCGIAQAFGFKATMDSIWFTEWVENNIGVVDLTKGLPLELGLTGKVTIPRGQTSQIELRLLPNSAVDVTLLSKATSEFNDITVEIPTKKIALDSPTNIPVFIAASESALPGTYKVLVSARTNDVTVSQFVTVTIEP